MDVILINPAGRVETHQELAVRGFTAVEPPVWAGMLASHLLELGFSVSIIDAEAEQLCPLEVALVVQAEKPAVACVVAYGAQPSASTQTMPEAARILRELKKRAPGSFSVVLGGHPSALPERTLREEECDGVVEGEGFWTLPALVQALKLTRPFLDVPGLWRRGGGAPESSPLVEKIPGVTWGLLPPLKHYRAHDWHCYGDLEHRSPYAAIYTSLGCPFRCTFCCINAPFGGSGIRFRDPVSVVDEVEQLVTRYGKLNLKIVDEMFVLNRRHVKKICELLVERGLGEKLNTWAYARVDTVESEMLDLMRRAGFTWLALGIESGSAHVRDGSEKTLDEHDIEQVVLDIHGAGINVVGNFIFGLPDDTVDTMQQTLDLALRLLPEHANFYSAMAYPGSKLYELALVGRKRLPGKWSGYSQHSADTLPLGTDTLCSEEVLAFRDKAWHTYFTDPVYLGMLRGRFGQETVEHVRRVTAVSLGRTST